MDCFVASLLAMTKAFVGRISASVIRLIFCAGGGGLRFANPPFASRAYVVVDLAPFGIGRLREIDARRNGDCTFQRTEQRMTAALASG